MSDLRFYASDELGADGYPPEWHKTIKHRIRAEAGHRCVRCHHPYVKGAGEWSPCDDQCRHGGDLRAGNPSQWTIYPSSSRRSAAGLLRGGTSPRSANAATSRSKARS